MNSIASAPFVVGCAIAVEIERKRKVLWFVKTSRTGQTSSAGGSLLIRDSVTSARGYPQATGSACDASCPSPKLHVREPLSESVIYKTQRSRLFQNGLRMGEGCNNVTRGVNSKRMEFLQGHLGRAPFGRLNKNPQLLLAVGVGGKSVLRTDRNLR